MNTDKKGKSKDPPALALNAPRVVEEVLRRLREMPMSELDVLLSRHERDDNAAKSA